MAVFDMKLEGLAEIERKLLSLEKKVGKKIVRKAVRAGAKPMLVAAKANAKSMVGGELGSLLSKNIVVRAFKKQRRSQFGVSVRMRSAVPEFVHKSRTKRITYIPSAIEYGHVDRAGGFVPAMPFMRPAFDTRKKASEKAVALTFKTEIEATAKRG